jgi:L-ascorbate metabolism protein UlaG (beta-lactamase superfamily)
LAQTQQASFDLEKWKDDVLRAAKLMQAKRIIPVHYNTWDLIAQDPMAWAKRVEAETKSQVSVNTWGYGGPVSG